MSRRCYALLIGMGSEVISELPGGQVLGPLLGSGPDVEAMASFLQGRHGDALELVQLVASAEHCAIDPIPTLTRVRASLDRFGRQALAGDQILMFFVGHGVRLPTRRPDLKGADGLDECLVLAEEPKRPSSSWDELVLRDFEIADVVRSWASRGILVTLIIDSCHSGGASKKAAADGVDLSPALTTLPTSRALTCRSAWLPETSEGSVFLASCQPHQLAHQLWIPELRTYRGCLTYHLLELLQSVEIETADWTWQRVHRHLVAAVHQRLAHQTPRLEGDITRRVLGFGQGAADDLGDPLPQVQPLRWRGQSLSSALEQSVAELLSDETLLESSHDGTSDLVIGLVGGGDLALRSGNEVLIEEPDLCWEAEKIACALVHIARFRKVRDLENPNSELAGHWKLRLEPIEDDATLESAGPAAYVLNIENTGDRVLYLTLLDLQPGWAIEQVYPTNGLSVPLEPRRFEEIRIDVEPSAGRLPREEVLVALVVTEEIDFHGFELPPWQALATSRDPVGQSFVQLHEVLAGRAQTARARGLWDWAVKKLVFTAVVLALTLTGPAAWPIEPSLTGGPALCDETPFEAGEMARFVVRFGLLKAGEGIACLGLSPAPDPEVELSSMPSGKLWRLAGRGRSSKVVSIFYKVDDLLHVWMDRSTLMPHRQEFVMRETNERATRRVLFDPAAGRTHFYRNRTFRRGRGPSLRDRYDDLAPGSFDPVSLFFHLRCRAAEPGDVLRIPVHENGKNREVEIEVGEAEVINTTLGEIEALSARVHLYFEGKLSNKKAFRVWVSNDERRIPLRFVADFTFAKLKGELAGYRAHHEAAVEGDLIGPLFAAQVPASDSKDRAADQLTGGALWNALCPLPVTGSVALITGPDSAPPHLDVAGQSQPPIPRP